MYFLSLHSLMYISVLLHHSNSKRFFKKFQTNIYSSLFTNGQKHIRTNKQTNKQTVKTLCCVHQHTHTHKLLSGKLQSTWRSISTASSLEASRFFFFFFVFSLFSFKGRRQVYSAQQVFFFQTQLTVIVTAVLYVSKTEKRNNNVLSELL